MKLTLFLSILLGDVVVDVASLECMRLDLKPRVKILSESFKSVESVTKVTCAFRCFREPKCKSASFYETDGICKFSELNIENAVTTTDERWQIIEKPGKLHNKILITHAHTRTHTPHTHSHRERERDRQTDRRTEVLLHEHAFYLFVRRKCLSQPPGGRRSTR